MTKSQVIKFFGSVQDAATSLKMTHQAIYAWKGNSVPYRTQLYIEEVTGGKLKAERKSRGRV